MSYTIECVAECANHLGESPIWDVEEGRLYWVDGTGRRIAADSLERLADHFASAALVPALFIRPERPTAGTVNLRRIRVTGQRTGGSVPDVL